MKVILIAVISLDGKITKWQDSPASAWASVEDSEHFRKMIKQSTLVVMGSKTYLINRPKPEKGRLRIVMTRSVQKYKQYAVRRQLEFRNEDPVQLITRLENTGYTQMLLVGGSKLATTFFKEKLIDELLLTIEPKIFAKGTSLVEEAKLDINLQLVSCKRLNKQGTMLLQYSVLR